ncbi:MAG TPA: 3-(methylthio)propionyl-CoA ligase [Steroidobacter sp.]
MLSRKGEIMYGQMMDRPLLLSAILRHADSHHPNQEIVSITADQPLHRYTYAQAFARARKLANALTRLGCSRSDRLGTLAWNDFRHFEIYYGVSCAGFVCHTINPRLFEDQICFIVNHAEDRVLFLDPAFVPLVEKLAPRLESIERYIVLTDDAHMPATKLPNAQSYESLIEPESDLFEWPDLDEREASALCYTSGTTGDPKGVLYSHRSMVLHTYAGALPDAFNLSAWDVVMPVVPMFHVNAWAIPYTTAMVGAKLVLPGPKMGDPQTLQSLIESERVTFAAGVPTVWQGLLAYLEASGKRIDSLKRLISGGSAVPPALMRQFKDRHGVQVVHAWGMTETSPIGTICTLTPEIEKLPPEEQEQILIKQGRTIFGIELKVTGEDGREVPHDGKTFGALKVRGPWVASGYYKRSGDPVFEPDGWFKTGDVATICPRGYMQITDRTKDVIKSGGEWISSIALENIAMAHPAVAQAAAIAVPHPKWQERPLLVVACKPGASVSERELLDFFVGKVAKWWIPDEVVFMDKLPLTATGKLSKLQLREQLAGYKLKEA